MNNRDSVIEDYFKVSEGLDGLNYPVIYTTYFYRYRICNIYVKKTIYLQATGMIS